MDYRFAHRAAGLPPSSIVYMSQYGAKYGDIISLGRGIPTFPTPSFIYDYLYKRSKTDSAVGQYSGPKIENELKSLIAKRMADSYGFTPQLNELCLTIGAIGGLYATMSALLDEGDEIVYFDPGYPLHLSQMDLIGAKPRFVSYDEKNNWSIDFNTLKKSITKKTKLVLLTNPNNPTGTLLSEDEVKELAHIVVKNNLILVVDATYEFLTYDNDYFSPLKVPQLRDNVILVKSFSKEFAMTGWRVGYLYGNQKLIEKINTLHFYYSLGSTTPSLIGAIAALSDKRTPTVVDEFRKQFSLSRDVICQRLDKLPRLFSYVKPQGAYYIFPRIVGFDDLTSLEFAKLVVDEARVVTIPGDSMGPVGKRHIRMSFCTSPTIINEAFDRIDQFAKKHNVYG